MSTLERYLVERKSKVGGLSRYFWQPDKRLRSNGYKLQRLPTNWREFTDASDLHKAANEQAREINQKMDHARVAEIILSVGLTSIPEQQAYRRGFQDGIEALKAELAIRKQQIGLMGNCLSHIENSPIAPGPIRIAATAAIVGASELTKQIAST